MAHKTYKFRLYPTKRQVEKLEQWLSLCCELYNAGLQERRDAWRLQRVSITRFSQHKQLPEIKALRPEVAGINSNVLQYVLGRLDKTFSLFFRRVKSGEKVGYPRFKNFRRYDSLSCASDRYKIINNKLDLSRFGKIKIKQDCKIEGKMKTLTIKREAEKWYAYIVVEFEPVPLLPSNESIGLDVGLESFATLSDGTEIENLRHYQSTQKKLRIVQRRVARRKKGSNRRRKAVLLLQKLHIKIRDQRSDFQHKLSTSLVQRYGLIAIEDLNIKGLAAGVLAKPISDVAWGAFIQKLNYKAANAGRQLIKVDPRGTSQTCTCGASVPKTLADRVHRCDSCGLVADRDHVSAQVILQRGEALRSVANVEH